MKFDLKLVENGKFFNILNKWEIDSSVEELPYYDGKSKRIVVLRKNPISNYFIESLADIHHDGVPSEIGKDRGHLIAQSFKEFLLTTDELSSFKNEVNIFFGRQNKANITPQSPASNRNSKDLTGQAKFELQISDYLKKSSDGKVYFEIEELTIDNIGLGRRIYIHWFNDEKCDNHIFIPDKR
jgi:hypothetical protein